MAWLMSHHSSDPTAPPSFYSIEYAVFNSTLMDPRVTPGNYFQVACDAIERHRWVLNTTSKLSSFSILRQVTGLKNSTQALILDPDRSSWFPAQLPPSNTSLRTLLFLHSDTSVHLYQIESVALAPLWDLTIQAGDLPGGDIDGAEIPPLSLIYNVPPASGVQIGGSRAGNKLWTSNATDVLRVSYPFGEVIQRFTSINDPLPSQQAWLALGLSPRVGSGENGSSLNILALSELTEQDVHEDTTAIGAMAPEQVLDPLNRRALPADSWSQCSINSEYYSVLAGACAPRASYSRPLSRSEHGGRTNLL